MKLIFIRLILGLAIAAGSTAAALAQDIKERNMRLGHLVPPDHVLAKGAQRFIELVGAKSGGKLKIKEFPGATLGSEQQQTGALQGGVQEFTMTGTVSVAGVLKETGLLDFLFTMDSAEQAEALIDGPFGKALWEKLPPKGLVVLANFESGARVVTNSKRPIVKAGDLKGLKVRVPPNPVYVEAFSAMGANPAAIAFGELYQALEMRTVDAQENPYAQILSSKFYEVQKYASATNHAFTLAVVLVSKKFWDKLAPAEQAVLRDAGAEASSYQRKLSRDAEKKSRDELRAKGMQINDIAPAELAQLREAVKPINERFAAQYDPALVKLFNTELEKTRAKR